MASVPRRQRDANVAQAPPKPRDATHLLTSSPTTAVETATTPTLPRLNLPNIQPNAKATPRKIALDPPILSPRLQGCLQDAFDKMDVVSRASVPRVPSSS